MKFASAIALILGSLCWSVQAATSGQQDDRAITQVVKLLQEMLEKSKTEGDTERDLFAKYKCYCDTNEEEKKALIEKLSEEIALLESQIEELQASSAKLSKEVEQLKRDMEANEGEQAEATSIREKENTAFLALQADLAAAIGQMDEAIATLSDVGADQTLQSAADHKQYMAGVDAGAALLKLQATVKSALIAARSFTSKQVPKAVDAFLQAPFTGTYTAQSGEVVGILKDMRDTFRSNKAAAEEEEARQLAAYNKCMEELTKAWELMNTARNKKQGELAGNDGSLSTKRGELEVATTTKAEAEDFLEKLLDMCAAKKKQYDERVALRSNEQTALAEAISILNSDAAFATFGTVDATKTGATSFTQMRRSTIRKHVALAVAAAASEDGSRRKLAQAFLQRAASETAQGSSSASMLGRIADMIKANNPFKVVLEEIEKMISLLAAEGEKDKKQKDWCDEERRVTNADIGTKTGEITGLNGDITGLEQEIDDPETGLKATIKTHEDTLQENYNSQVTETKERKEENIAYQADISNLVEAETLVERAIVVLRKYYSKISEQIKAEMSLMQSRKNRKDDPAPPSTWDDKYKGQSEAGGGDAISMLEFILTNTKAEEKQAHEDEQSAQHAYEDSMQALKDEEATTQTALAETRKTLAEKEELLMQKRKDLEKTEAEKKALEEYLVEIKPGCDFITENIDLRDTNRLNEKTALENAVQLIQGTPAYQEAMAAAHTESLGDCKDICAVNEDVVECKACLAKTSIPGYCAGHPSTKGCI